MSHDSILTCRGEAYKDLPAAVIKYFSEQQLRTKSSHRTRMKRRREKKLKYNENLHGEVVRRFRASCLSHRSTIVVGTMHEFTLIDDTILQPVVSTLTICIRMKMYMNCSSAFTFPFPYLLQQHTFKCSFI